MNERAPLGGGPSEVVAEVRHEVLMMGEVAVQVVGDDVGAASLHVEANEAARRAELENALAAEIDAAEVSVDPGSEVPRSFDRPVTRDVDGVIEVALREVGDRPGGSVRSVGGAVRHHERPAGTGRRTSTAALRTIQEKVACRGAALSSMKRVARGCGNKKMPSRSARPAVNSGSAATRPLATSPRFVSSKCTPHQFSRRVFPNRCRLHCDGGRI